MNSFENGTRNEVLAAAALVLVLMWFLVGPMLTGEKQVAQSTGNPNEPDQALAAAPEPKADPANVSESEITQLKIQADQVGNLVSTGKEVFNANCQQCHAINEQVVGPALSGILNRRDTDWLVNFIKYPQKVIDSGDEYAVKLYEQYQQYMPNHDFLSDDEIKGVIAYVSAFE